MDRLVRAGVIDLGRMVELLSVNPARILGLKKGTLKPGADADITVIDPGRTMKVEAKHFASRSRNTPFDGWRLTGWPVLTIVGGRVVHELKNAAR
jgi:dihydroorotase